MKKLISLLLCLAMLFSLCSVAFAEMAVPEEKSVPSFGSSLWNAYTGMWQKAIENYDPEKTAEWIGDMAQYSAETVGKISGYVAEKVGEQVADRAIPGADASAIADALENAIADGGKIVSGMIRGGSEIAQQFITRSTAVLDKLQDSPVRQLLPTPKPEVKYVALGDSTAMGYYVGNYNDYYRYRHDVGPDHNGVASCDYSTYSLFSKYLTDQDNEVKGTDFTATGMRPMELHALLDSDFFYSLNPKVHDRSGMICDNWCIDHLDDYMFKESAYSYKDKNVAHDPTKNTPASLDIDGVYQKTNELFNTRIAEADIITYDLLNGDALYLMDRIQDLIGNADDYADYYANDTFAVAMSRWGCDAVAQGAVELRSKINDLLGGIGLPADMVTEVVDMILYTYTNMTYNFSQTVAEIYEDNSDVELIVIAPSNPTKGLTLIYNGISINVGKIFDFLVDAVTFYVVKCDANASRYILADCSTGVESCLQAFRNGDFMKPEYETFRKELAQDIKDSFKFDITFDEAVAARIQKACRLDSADLAALISEKFQVEAVHNALTKDDATAAEQSALFLYLVTGSSRGVLLHPSANGCQQKANAIALAHERGYTADGTYLARAIQTSEYLTANVIGSMIGCETSQSNLKTFFSDIFTPVIDLSDLIAGLLKK